MQKKCLCLIGPLLHSLCYLMTKLFFCVSTKAPKLRQRGASCFASCKAPSVWFCLIPRCQFDCDTVTNMFELPWWECFTPVPFDFPGNVYIIPQCCACSFTLERVVTFNTSEREAPCYYSARSWYICTCAKTNMRHITWTHKWACWANKHLIQSFWIFF